METPLEGFVGRRINEVLHVHDYLQLEIGDNILTVYNPYKVMVKGVITREEILKGKLVHSAKIDNSNHILMLAFDQDVIFEVDISEPSYRGPEAVTIKRPGKALVAF